MQKILICDCRFLVEQTEYEKAYRRVSAFRQKKADACRQPMDRARCIGAGLLLRAAFFSYLDGLEKKNSGQLLESLSVADLFRESLEEREEQYRLLKECADAQGKSHWGGEGEVDPVLGIQVPFVSISHSGEFAAVAVSDHPIGLDIQKKRRISDAMIKKVFSPLEKQTYEKLMESDMVQAEQYLLAGWCEKEAAAKLDGRGIFVMMKEVAKDDWKQSLGIQTASISFHEDYALCYASWCSSFASSDS